MVTHKHMYIQITLNGPNRVCGGVCVKVMGAGVINWRWSGEGTGTVGRRICFSVVLTFLFIYLFYISTAVSPPIFLSQSTLPFPSQATPSPNPLLFCLHPGKDQVSHQYQQNMVYQSCSNPKHFPYIKAEQDKLG